MGILLHFEKYVCPPTGLRPRYDRRMPKPTLWIAPFFGNRIRLLAPGAPRVAPFPLVAPRPPRGRISAAARGSLRRVHGGSRTRRPRAGRVASRLGLRVNRRIKRAAVTCKVT